MPEIHNYVLMIENDSDDAYYRAGANSVITKPHSVESTKNKILTFFNYWFNVAELTQAC